MVKVKYPFFLFVMLLPSGEAPNFTFPVLLSMAFGFSIRVGLDWNNSRITVKRTITQLIYSISLCYMSLFIWQDYEIKYNIVYTTFTISLFSITIVSEADKAFEVGFKAYLLKWLRNITAKETENDNI